LSAVLKENTIYNYVNSVVAAPATDLVALDLHETKEAKVQRIILDGVKDHLIPHLVEKKTAKEMWDALKNLFEVKKENRNVALKAKLHDTNMGKEESFSSYLTRVAQVKDELAAVGEVITDYELVRTALNGFTKEWDFLKCVVDMSIYQIGADCGMISLKRRSEKDLRAVNKRQTEMMRMLLLLQRARRKEVLEGT
jgi:hypothetical protein